MPKLVCDQPSPVEVVEYYTIVGLPGNPQVDRIPEGPYAFEYELGDKNLSGAYSVLVSACNQWQCSLPAPLEFTVPERPSVPLGLSISFT